MYCIERLRHYFESGRAGDKLYCQEKFLTVIMLEGHVCGPFTSLCPFIFVGPFTCMGLFASVWSFHYHMGPSPGWRDSGWSVPTLLEGKQKAGIYFSVM